MPFAIGCMHDNEWTAMDNMCTYAKLAPGLHNQLSLPALVVQLQALGDDVLVPPAVSVVLAAELLDEVCQAVAGDTVGHHCRARIFPGARKNNRACQRMGDQQLAGKARASACITKLARMLRGSHRCKPHEQHILLLLDLQEQKARKAAVKAMQEKAAQGRYTIALTQQP